MNPMNPINPSHLYTSDAADDPLNVDHRGRPINYNQPISPYHP